MVDYIYKLYAVTYISVISFSFFLAFVLYLSELILLLPKVFDF